MKILLIGIWNLLYVIVNCKVIELDLSFSTLINDGPWLVKFYAPWCGYCRKLEPVYSELEVQSRSLSIKIGRIDATRFPEVSSLYQIRGYPTIKFINGSNVYTHEGDRTVQHLLRFIRRALGPPVKHLPSIGRFHENLEQQQFEPFFLYVGPKDSYLRKVYGEIADTLRLNSYFYSTEAVFIPEEFTGNLNLVPTLSDSDNGTIIVWKEERKTVFQLTESVDNLNNSLKHWILVNRFQFFPKVTHQDLWELEVLQKPVVIFLLNATDVPEHSLKDIDPNNDNSASIRFIVLGQKLLESSDQNLNDFQFVWSTDTGSMSDLAMTGLLTPNLLIYQPWNSTIYLHPEYSNYHKLRSMTNDDILAFLNSFRSGEIQGFGGTGFKAKMHRAGYDFVTGLIEFITTTPLLAMFIIGIPLSVISFLCYAICCMDSGESPEYRRSELRSQKKIRTPLYETPLRSSEELNIKSDKDKKID